jgi:hypothetical protein
MVGPVGTGRPVGDGFHAEVVGDEQVASMFNDIAVKLDTRPPLVLGALALLRWNRSHGSCPSRSRPPRQAHARLGGPGHRYLNEEQRASQADTRETGGLAN